MKLREEMNYLAAELAEVLAVLTDFHLLDDLTKTSTITGPVLADDPDLLRSLRHLLLLHSLSTTTSAADGEEETLIGEMMIYICLRFSKYGLWAKCSISAQLLKAAQMSA